MNNKKREKLLAKSIKLQAMAAEGSNDAVQIESLLTATRVNGSISGTCNEYKTYQGQVKELYRKYDGEADFGNSQARAVIDLRSAFISGEGLSINAKKPAFEKWLKEFLKVNKFEGSRFMDAVLGSEMTGKALFTLSVKPGEYPKIMRIPYGPTNPYIVKLGNKYDPDSVVDVVVKRQGQEQSLGLSNFVYIRTGGTDLDVNKTTTKTGLVLSDLEGYDRATKDLRRLNHVSARITPTFETKNLTETTELVKYLKGISWKIGQAFMGTAKFKYEVPGTGAHENLKTELSTTIKNIASTTGVPVHWIGWVDLMSNKSTAETLYDTLGNATIRERTLFAEGIYELLIKAQEMYIDAGGTDIRTVTTNFEVSIPVVDYSKFLDMIKGMSMAYNDGVISRADYQSGIAGINPLQTERNLKIEQKEDEKALVSKSDLNIKEVMENDK